MRSCCSGAIEKIAAVACDYLQSFKPLSITIYETSSPRLYCILCFICNSLCIFIHNIVALSCFLNDWSWFLDNIMTIFFIVGEWLSHVLYPAIPDIWVAGGLSACPWIRPFFIYHPVPWPLWKICLQNTSICLPFVIYSLHTIQVLTFFSLLFFFLAEHYYSK